MPFARISLLRGRSPAWLAALSDGLHRALVESFEVPEADRFQLIHQHEPGEMAFDPVYAGGRDLKAPRSADFVLIAITAGRERRQDTRNAFYRRLAALLAEAPGLRPEDVMVVITTTASGEWSFGGGEPLAPASAPPPPDIASGPFEAEMLAEGSADGDLTAMRATFAPGSITRWHSHPRGQILYVLAGEGRVQRAGGPVETVREGGCLRFAPGERHWHGAAPDSPFTYVSVQAVRDGSAVAWQEPVA